MAVLRQARMAQPPRDDMDPRATGTLPGNMGQNQPPELPQPPVGPTGPPAPPQDPNDARGGTGPRDQGIPTGGNEGTAPRPRTPTPGAGSVDTVGIPPFQPMPSTPTVSLTRPMGQRGIYGGAGGLTGGGFGLGQDPTSNQASDPISTLMKLLQNKGSF